MKAVVEKSLASKRGLVTGLDFVALTAFVLVSSVAVGCKTHQPEPVAYPPPEREVVAAEDWPEPTDEIEWSESALNDALGLWIEAEPMPMINGPHMLMHLEIPAMMCTNCERAVRRLAESVERTRVVAIDHETDSVHLLVPIAASSRVVRILSTNGWRVVAIDAAFAEDGPYELAKPELEYDEADTDEPKQDADEVIPREP